MMNTLLVALGGNAILRPGQKGTYEEQLENVRVCSERLVELYQCGYRLVITHGNGPQVGNLLIQNQCAKSQIPIQPLHGCVAQTQGQIGFLLQSCLDNALRQKGITTGTTAIVTRVLVDTNDKAFLTPTKPIGPFFSEDHAKRQLALGETWMNDSDRGWRRVVPSPQPLKILELEAIRSVLDHNGVVVAVGGGGIPIAEKDNQLVGVEAVIDKDFASSLLARQLNVDTFVILTDINNVKLNFGQPDEQDLSHMTTDTAERYLMDNQFGAGSMAPKIRAAVDFVRAGGRKTIITSLDQVVSALKGRAGTVIVP